MFCVSVTPSNTADAMQKRRRSEGVAVAVSPVVSFGGEDEYVPKFEVPGGGTPTDSEDRRDIVIQHYRDMRSHQTLNYVLAMHEKYEKFDNGEMTVWEAFERLDEYRDSSDPYEDLTVLEHSLQCAEGVRGGGHPDWFQLVGLIHDLGKIQFLWGSRENGMEGTKTGKQWALGGDTWVVGCRLPDSLIFPELNSLCADMHEAVLGTPLGRYQANCGMDKVLLTWGHDEYLYRFLVHNKIQLPTEALSMIRYHSLYAWHSFGAYEHLMKEEDFELREYVQEFNKFDLHARSIARPDIAELKPYYERIINKYMPGRLKW